MCAVASGVRTTRRAASGPRRKARISTAAVPFHWTSDLHCAHPADRSDAGHSSCSFDRSSGTDTMDLIPSNYFLTDAFDELIAPDGRPRPAAVPLFRYLESLEPGVLAARRDAVDAAIMAMGITFTVYSDGANIDRAWPFDIVPRVIAAHRVAAHRGRPQAAPDGPEPVHRRPLQRAAHRQGRRVSARGAGGVGELPRAVPRHLAPFWGVGAHLRHRSGARQGRHRLRPGGQPARAVGRVLHAREPPADEAAVPRGFRGQQHPAGRRLPDPAARHAGALSPREGDPPGRRRADARHLQLGLLRAQLPRPADGRLPGGGHATWSSRTTTASTCGRSRDCAAST